MSIKLDNVHCQCTDKQHLDSVSHQKTKRKEDMKLDGADVGEDVGELREQMKGVHDHISLYTCMAFSEVKRDIIMCFMVIINKKIK